MFKKNQNKNIVFYANERALAAFPLPDRAGKFLPSWYKSCPTHNGDYFASTVKRCIPFRESLTNGFIIPLWHDAHFKIAEASDGKNYLSCVQSRAPEKIGQETDLADAPSLPTTGLISYHPSEQYADYAKIDKKAYPNYAHVVKFHSPYTIQTPKGWSILMKPVANDFASPVVPFEAVIDTDRYCGKINLPCFIRAQEKEFSMPLGTPLVQVIPFKREKVTIKREKYTEETLKKFDIELLRFATMLQGQYQKFWWHRTQDFEEKK